jgi:hypothetical protein
LKAGKAVFVEKPFAITYQQLEEVIATLQTTDGRIMVGFNRRFSPFTIEIKKLLSNRQAPFCINYRVNAGIIPKDNWIHDPVEGGGRIIGEVCHFVDFLHYIIAAQPIKVYAEGVSEDNDNVFITISFKDGSVGTIGYHLIVLQDYLECLILLKNNSQNYPSLFDDKIKQMLNFLIEILHPDGNIPLFNDSAFGVARSPQDLFAIGAALFKDSRFKATANRFSLFPYLLLGAEGKAAFDEIIASQDSQRQNIALDGSGYYVMRDESNDKFMIIDCGEIGAEYLTGHSHCDTLSYELSIRQERIIVDSGVYAYESREWRDYCRSTRAHNTVAIDNREQSEIWSAFRVARRAKPIEVKWVETENIIFFEGSHNGYTRLGQKLFHKRRIFFVEKRFWIIFDDIRGSGRHTAESYIHIVPDVQFQVNDREKNYQTHVTKNGINALIKFFGADGVRIIEGQMNPIQGWYLPEFGKRFRNKTIILDKAGELPLQFGYLILPYVTTVVDFECEYNLLGEVRLRIRLDDSLYVVECRVDELKFQKQ